MKFEFNPQMCGFSENNQFVRRVKMRNLRALKKDNKDKDSKKKDKKQEDKYFILSDEDDSDADYYCKNSCTSFPVNQKWYAVVVTSMDGTIEYFADDRICEGTDFWISHEGQPLAEELMFKVYANEELLQTVTMNASCACNEGEINKGHSWGSFILKDFEEY